ncbi:MAG: hypothetical protein HYY18_20625 [Planctomycetes bacterium]|nr:hypothetical protein [Planctomycetota bacterium]
MKRSSAAEPVELSVARLDQRIQGLAALEADDVTQLRGLTADAGIRILEDLLDAGFDMINAMIEAHRRTGGDADRLARYLLQDEVR